MTEYAECPECLNDGPQEVVSDDELECGTCSAVFANPFAGEES